MFDAMTLIQETVRLPFAASSTPAMARARIEAFLTRVGASPEAVDDALIVLSEMIANAVCHGLPTTDGSIEMRWSISGDLLELSVYDAGRGGALEPVDFDEDSLSGRGLGIIDRVADRWWVDMSQGTRVNAELAVSST